MKRKLFLLSLMLVISSATVFSTTWVVNNSGNTFTPATITITVGDDVNFVIGAIHNVREVSQATWDANGSTALAGGFSLPLGGGLVSAGDLEVGTHYYVCVPHAAMAMKGTIIVQNVTGVEKPKAEFGLLIYPNPSQDFLTIRSETGFAGSKFFITDQTGRQLFNGILSEESTPVDISALRPGLYFVQVAGVRKQSLKLIRK